MLNVLWLWKKITHNKKKAFFLFTPSGLSRALWCWEKKGGPDKFNFHPASPHGQRIPRSRHDLVKELQHRQNAWRRRFLSARAVLLFFTHLRQKTKTRVIQLKRQLLCNRAPPVQHAVQATPSTSFFFFLPDIKTNLCPAMAAHLRAPFWCVIIRTSGVCKSVRKREIGSWGKKVRWFKSTFLFFFSFFDVALETCLKILCGFTFWTFPAFNWTCQAPRRIGTVQVRCSQCDCQCEEHPAATAEKGQGALVIKTDRIWKPVV